LINYLLSSLNTAGIPWLYTYASADWETVPKDILDLAAAAKGNACLVNFAPQWDVLNHAATRVFVVSLRVLHLLIDRHIAVATQLEK